MANECLLIKWWWRFGAESNTLWKRVLCSRYGSVGGNWLPSTSFSGSYSKIWSGIINVGQSNPQLLSVFLDNSRVVVGNGIRIQFWTDYWMGACCVKNEFPRLYSLSTKKEVSLRVVSQRNEASPRWIFKFSRRLLGWENDELRRLSTFLEQNLVGLSDREDRLGWLASPSAEFSVSSLYSLAVPSARVVVTKLIWNKFSPPKVQFLVWLAWNGRLKTASFLQRIGVLEPEASAMCVFCHEGLESVFHLLIWCPFAWRIWCDLMQWWGLTCVIPKTVEGILNWWRGFKWRNNLNMIWRIIPFAVLWSLWKFRNEKVFCASQMHLEELCELIKTRIALWAKFYTQDCCYSVQQIICNIQEIRLGNG
ncbi:uncharacterized protein LOC114260998 [Camellia sinensis]|uniref:uncharacterized protein LOC114260998 n=1 Tax=Camellia sinensis TaxID=4442 RepID=UPI0010356826|nr:uncharacterized protein LOC114260998 [Camellia sinensis]